MTAIITITIALLIAPAALLVYRARGVKRDRRERLRAMRKFYGYNR